LVARGRFEKQPAAPASWIDFVHELDPQPEALRAFARDLAREVEQVCGLATPGVTHVAAAGRDDEFSTLLTFEPRWQWFTAPDGAPLACAVAGDGPPVLLVHRGGSTDHADLGRLLVALAGEFTVYGLDRRGHGRSGPYQPGHTIEREFEDVAAVVDAIDGPVPVVGNGIGAVCALEAARLSDRINAVVAASPEFESNRRAIQALFTLPTDSPTATPPWFDWAEARGHDPLDGALETEMSALDAYRFAPDRFRSLATPVLIVVHAAPSRPAGESPQWKAARAIQAAVPGLRLVQTLDTHRLERVPEVMTLLRQAAAGR
jgi:pimeloyl-ACP methyl ester carboxylesterase